MRNAWKGLVVGALTGVVAGLGLDIVDSTARRARQGASKTANALSEHLPDLTDSLKSTAATAADKAGNAVQHTTGTVSEAAHNLPGKNRS